MIKQQLQADQIKALKSGDKFKLNTLRYILAQIQNKEIDKQKSLTEEELISLLRKISDDLRESVAAFEKGRREDLVAEHKDQLKIVTAYLPPELSDEALKHELKKIISQNRQLYQKNPRALVGVCVGKLKNQARPQRIIKILQSLI